LIRDAVEIDPLRLLLERAFWSARVSGRPDWHRMIVAVLKNRLLQLSDRTFREQDFGAASLLELTARYPDLVAIDRSAKPVVIEWIGPRTLGADTGQTRRVRSDLWRAALDFSSGLEYEWNTAAGDARPVEHADPGRRLPTVTPETLARWRAAFVVDHAPAVASGDRERLQQWAVQAFGSQGLPRPLRARWNEHLKHQVIGHLTVWFAASGQPVPDLFER
jgi:hypothetical protein